METNTVASRGRVLLLVLLLFLICPEAPRAAPPDANATAKPKADKDLEYDAKRPLLTLHTPNVRQHSMTELDAVLDASVAGEQADGPRPIVIYIHGRGNEPKKSFTDTTLTKGYLLKKIESYDVAAIGFNWESKAFWCGRPIEEAQRSAADFINLLLALQTHRQAHPTFWEHRPLILFTHSMGSFVLAAAADSAVPTEPFVDQLIVSAADTPAASHATWLSKITFVKQVLVLSNPTDKTLRRSVGCDDGLIHNNAAPQYRGPRLGQLQAADTSTVRDPRATYTQISAAKHHRYFSKGGQEHNPDTCRLLANAFHGKPLDLAAGWMLRPNVYHIPSRSMPGDSCFAGAIAEDDADDEDD